MEKKKVLSQFPEVPSPVRKYPQADTPKVLPFHPVKGSFGGIVLVKFFIAGIKCQKQLKEEGFILNCNVSSSRGEGLIEFTVWGGHSGGTLPPGQSGLRKHGLSAKNGHHL